MLVAVAAEMSPGSHRKKDVTVQSEDSAATAAAAVE